MEYEITMMKGCFRHSIVLCRENKEVLRNKFAVFRTERRMHTGVSYLKVQIYFFTIPKFGIEIPDSQAVKGAGLYK